MSRQFAHVWDASRCINCGACQVACAATNYPQLADAGAEIARGLATNISRVIEEKSGTTTLMLMQCQQCATAPCLVKCPAKAISRDADGLVRTDEEKCIKCQLCVAECPYGARWTDPVSMVPKSCMGPGCRSLVAAGQLPACVQACPVLARAFGNVTDPASEVSRRIAQPGYRRVRADKGTRPNFYVMQRS